MVAWVGVLEWKLIINDYEGSYWSDKNILKRSDDDGCTAQYICYKSLNLNWVNFTVC